MNPAEPPGGAWQPGACTLGSQGGAGAGAWAGVPGRIRCGRLGRGPRAEHGPALGSRLPAENSQSRCPHSSHQPVARDCGWAELKSAECSGLGRFGPNKGKGACLSESCVGRYSLGLSKRQYTDFTATVLLASRDNEITWFHMWSECPLPGQRRLRVWALPPAPWPRSGCLASLSPDPFSCLCASFPPRDPYRTSLPLHSGHWGPGIPCGETGLLQGRRKRSYPCFAVIRSLFPGRMGWRSAFSHSHTPKARGVQTRRTVHCEAQVLCLKDHPCHLPPRAGLHSVLSTVDITATMHQLWAQVWGALLPSVRHDGNLASLGRAPQTGGFCPTNSLCVEVPAQVHPLPG